MSKGFATRWRHGQGPGSQRRTRARHRRWHRSGTQTLSGTSCASGSCQHLLALAHAESVAKGLSSGGTTSVAVPHDHHTHRRDWKGLEGWQGGRFWRHICWLLLVQVAIALGAGVQHVGVGKEATAFGTQVVALLPPPLLLCSAMAAGPNRRSKSIKYGWIEVGWGNEKRRAEGIKKASVKVCRPNKVMNSWYAGHWRMLLPGGGWWQQVDASCCPVTSGCRRHQCVQWSPMDLRIFPSGILMHQVVCGLVAMDIWIRTASIQLIQCR